MKPILCIQFPEYNPDVSLSMYRISHEFSNRFGDEYDVVSVCKEVNLKSQGPMVKIEINDDTDINELLRKISNAKLEVMEEKKDDIS